ncbi:YcxB family protein [Shewanella psychromarinicola]|uniref:YcxB family protein n=1 Tax=Shewanella psychromarinicola TaxID=2487742 RepID=A0A3N4DEN1_9GAMM|nr:YcxB family protein [Shewanella psychromarinicola]AZG37252.1 YcxB family protein [Shewanella psychromarinicola]MCL1084414.1 YcxB family protein [Shewanella psychromarinicola]RPA22987.1 YcxB family protein [Shewanella psychromarinicola]
MPQAFSYTTEYVLDKTYFEECYQQSINPNPSPKRFIKTTIFALVGLAILMLDSLSSAAMSTKETYYLGYFFIGLAVVEFLSIRFNKTWWLWRQMMSKAAGEHVNLTIDDHGINSQSAHVNQQILWTDMYRIIETDVGFLIKLQKTTTYLSKRCLDENAIDFINQKQ